MNAEDRVQSSDLMMLGGDNPTTWIVYNRLVREFGLFPCLIEDSLPRSVLLKNRAKKLGWADVASQMVFASLIRPILRYQSSRRIREICALHDLEAVCPVTPAISHVESMNSAEAIALVRGHAPKVVIINGTRILKSAVLQAAHARFINIHQGITPLYRGAHGGYWALHQDDPEHCGVTVHLVDEGIDTGNIIGQAQIAPTPQDTFVTYPFLQTAAALPILIRSIEEAREGTLETHPISGPSAVWYHPRLGQYLGARLRGVR